MKRKRLSRSERRDLNRDTGAVAENVAAAAYDRYSAFQDSGEFDLATKSGSIAEVKSTLTHLGESPFGLSKRPVELEQQCPEVVHLLAGQFLVAVLVRRLGRSHARSGRHRRRGACRPSRV